MDYVLFKKNGGSYIQRNIYPRLLAKIVFERLSDLEVVELIDDCKDPNELARAMRETGDYLMSQSKSKQGEAKQKYAGFFIAENIIDLPDMMQIISLRHGAMVSFNYEDSYMQEFETWIRHAEYITFNGKPLEEQDLKEFLAESWNFLAETEMLEDELGEEFE
jgi:hypothetical protein